MFTGLTCVYRHSFLAFAYCAFSFVISKQNCFAFADNKLFESSLSSSSSQWTVEHSLNETLLNSLLKVFGLENKHATRKARHLTAPQYMLDLYNSIAESRTGVTHTPNPYHANTVTSFLDKDSSNPLHFFFDLFDVIPKDVRILEAELHLYKMRAHSKRIRADPRSNLLEVRVYQLLKDGSIYHSDKKLLDSRRMSTNSVGWEVFYVKDAVLDWIRDHRNNYGLLITVASLSKEKIGEHSLRFARRHQQHSNKHPILVVFTDDGRNKMRNSTSSYARLDKHDFGYPELSLRASLNKFETSTETMNKMKAKNGDKTEIKIAADHRERRSLKSSSNLQKHSKHEHHGHIHGRHKEQQLSERQPINWDKFESSWKSPSSSASPCSRHELYVDFSRIGWSSWIISPKGYNAFFCKGDCDFPLGHKHSPTNHASVQSIVHELRLMPNVDKPCCVPNKLLPITLLYFDEQENVILKQYDDMVVDSCGCH